MKKRIASIFACGVIAAGSIAGFAGCKESGLKLTVWAPAAQQDTIAEMVEQFKAANPDTEYNIQIGISEEDMAYDNVSKDPSAAADVYCYASDQLVPLLQVGALARIGGTNLDKIKEANSEESVDACTITYGEEERVYGYPYASDNGYFMIYDKSVLTESDVTSLETIIDKCEEAGKKIGWALDVPYYTAGFFFTFGCEFDVSFDYTQNYKASVTLNGFDGVEGEKASDAMLKLANSSAFAGLNTDNTTITTGFSTHNMAVAVTGTWIAKNIQQSLGANYGVCELPTVTVDGDTQHLMSFKGYKFFGVNSHSKNISEAHKLALFLSGEDMQKTRFEKHLIGPTNTAVSNLDIVKNDPTIQALNAQNAYAVEQVSVPSNFWQPLKDYFLYLKDGLTDGNSLRNMVELMQSKLS